MVNIMRGRRAKGSGDSQNSFGVIHAGVKEGLDHSESKFGVLGPGGSFLGLFFCRILHKILIDLVTAKQSINNRSQKQKKKN